MRQESTPLRDKFPKPFVPGKNTANTYANHTTDTPLEHDERRARLSARLRELQRESGLSTRQLAKRAGLSRQTTMTALKSGLKTSTRTYDKLFKALDTTPRLEGGLKPKLSQEDLEVAMAYHDAPTKVRNFAAQILKTGEYADPSLDSDLLMLMQEIKRLAPNERQFIRMFVSYALEPTRSEPPDES